MSSFKELDESIHDVTLWDTVKHLGLGAVCLVCLIIISAMLYHVCIQPTAVQRERKRQRDGDNSGLRYGEISLVTFEEKRELSRRRR